MPKPETIEKLQETEKPKITVVAPHLGDLVVEKRTDEGNVKFEFPPEKPPEGSPAETYGLTPKMLSRLQAEQSAGKARVAAAEEQRRLHPPKPPTRKEAQATGSSTPVFRPADFREYAQNFNSPVQSKDKLNQH